MQRLILDEEQQMLRESAAGFLKDSGSVSQLRALRDNRDETGFSGELWRKMVEMGLAGTLIPEAFGGSAFGHVGMGQVSEQAGRNLTASPLFATGILGVSALLAGNDSQKQHLEAIAAGELLTALAIDEQGRHTPNLVRTTASASGDGYVLDGQKSFVIDGHVANTLIVSARTAGEVDDEAGITLFLVDAGADGVEIERTIMVDSHNAAIVRFNGVLVPSSAVLGSVDQGFAVLSPLLDIGNAHLAAELLGVAQESFDQTMNYIRDRKQFGVTVASFQALQHRAAHLFSELELLKSVVLKALRSLDDQADNTAAMVSLAKAKACEIAQLATNEGVQMHGGVGMTDEYDIGLFMKRARPLQQLFGDYAYHADRYARLSGY